MPIKEKEAILTEWNQTKCEAKAYSYISKSKEKQADHRIERTIFIRYKIKGQIILDPVTKKVKIALIL